MQCFLLYQNNLSIVEIKLKKSELGFLSSQKQEAADKKDKLKKEEARMVLITDKLNAFEKQLGPICGMYMTNDNV